MIYQSTPYTALRIVALAVLTLPLMASAQIAPSPAEKNWREGNDAVGHFKHGYFDILKWEKDAVPAAADQEQIAASLRLMTVVEAARQAWRAHVQLVMPMNQIGGAT